VERRIGLNKPKKRGFVEPGSEWAFQTGVKWNHCNGKPTMKYRQYLAMKEWCGRMREVLRTAYCSISNGFELLRAFQSGDNYATMKRTII
jgi:hypothetical protein